MDIGFIGPGAMGAHMARHLIGTGFSWHVFDTNRQAIRHGLERSAAAHAHGGAQEDMTFIVEGLERAARAMIART